MSTAIAEGAPATPIAEVPSFTVTLIIRRFDPDVDTEPHWQDFDVEMHGTDRVLDALHKIKWEIDGSLSFRRSCAHGVCGSDAMRINGRNRLACKLLIPGKVEGVTGVNLPMLVRALTYRKEPLKTVVAKAISGGIEGVMQMPISQVRNAATGN